MTLFSQHRNAEKALGGSQTAVRATIFGLFAAALVLVFLCSAVVSAATLADTVMTAGARLSFETGPQSAQVFSNIVTVQVLPKFAVSLRGGGRLTAFPGQQVHLPLVMENQANRSDILLFAGSGDLPAASIERYYDLDHSGTVSVGDPPWTDRDAHGNYITPPWTPNQSEGIVGLVAIPEDLPLGAYQLDFDLWSQTDPTAADSAGFVITVCNWRPFLVLQGDADVYARETFSLDLRFGNHGPGTMEAVSVVLPLDPRANYISSKPQGDYDPQGHVLTWTFAELSAGELNEIEISLQADIQGQSAVLVHEAELKCDGLPLLASRWQTTVAQPGPHSIELTPEPSILPGDGVAQSVLTAVVSDYFRRPVPDGTEVSFAAPDGFLFDAQNGHVVSETAGGRATAIFVAPELKGTAIEMVPVTAEVVGYNDEPLTAEAEVMIVPGGLLGRFWNLERNWPEAAATVQLRLAGTILAETQTDWQGYYLLPYPGPGDYQLWFEWMEPGGPTRQLVVPLSSQKPAGSLVFGPTAVEGRVRDQYGQPLVNTKLALYDDQGTRRSEARSDFEGRFVFLLAEPISPPVSAAVGSGLWVAAAWTDDNARGQKSLREPLPGDSLWNLQLQLSASGIVLDGSTGQPISGAAVSLYHGGQPQPHTLVDLSDWFGHDQTNPWQTDSSGTFLFAAPPGYYYLYGEASGYFPNQTEPKTYLDGMVGEVIILYPMGTGDIDFDKTPSVDRTIPGARLEYRISLRSEQTASMAGVVIEDDLPADFELAPETVSGGGSYCSIEHRIRWELDGLSSDGVELSYQGTVAKVPGNSVLVNRAYLHLAGYEHYSYAAALVEIGQAPAAEFTARPEAVRSGEFVHYQLNLSNPESDGAPLTELYALLQPPPGFVYAAGSSVIDGRSIADPLIEDDGWIWPLGSLEPGAEKVLTFKSVVSTAAAGKDGLHWLDVHGVWDGAQNFAFAPMSAVVRVLPGVFSSLGILFGQVYSDDNENGRRDPGEAGIGQARIYLDDGRRIETDSDGRFSVSGLQPGRYTAVLDADSLPWGFIPAADPASWSIKIFPNGLAQLDIAVEQEAWRRASWPLVVNLGAADNGSVPLQVTVTNPHGEEAVIDLAVLPWSIPNGCAELETWHHDGPIVLQPHETRSFYGVIRCPMEDDTVGTVGVTAMVGQRSSPDQPAEHWAAVESSLRAVGRFAHNGTETGFVAPLNGEILPLRHITATVEGPLDAVLQLYANDEKVASERIGRIVTNHETQMQELTYYSVGLQAGLNTLRLVIDQHGHLQEETITVFVAGPPDSIYALGEPALVWEDGQPRLRAAVAVVNTDRTPVIHPAALRVTVQGGVLDNGVQLPGQAAWEVQSQGGLLLLTIIPEDISSVPVTVSVTLGSRTLQLRAPALQPTGSTLWAVGAQAVLQFQPELSLRGHFSGYFHTSEDWNVAARLDTRRLSGSPGYIGVQDPPAFLGDQSIVTDATPSRDAVYLRLEHSGFLLLYGDFASGWAAKTRLTNLERPVTGFHGYWADLDMEAYVFFARQEEIVERIEPTGLADFYYTKEYPIIPGSERIALLIHEPGDSTQIHARVPLTRRRDYVLDYDTGSLRFASPVPKQDAAGHSVLIEVAYGLPGQSLSASGFGVRTTLTAGPHHSLTASVVGGTAVYDDNRMAAAVDAAAAFDGPLSGSISAAAAVMIPGPGQAVAGAVEVKLCPGVVVTADGFWASAGFALPGSEPEPNGRWQVSADLEIAPAERWSAGYEVLWSGDFDGPPQLKEHLRLEMQLLPNITAATGIRSSADEGNWLAARDSVRAYVGGQWELSADTKLAVEYETRVAGLPTPSQFKLRFDHQISSQLRLAVDYSPSSGSRSVNPWTFAIEAYPLDGSKIFASYRPAVAASHSAAASLGLVQDWEFGDALSVAVSAEHRRQSTALGEEAVSNLASLRLAYHPSSALGLTFGQELHANQGGIAASTRVEAAGTLSDYGLSYRVLGLWRTLGSAPVRERELVGEFHSALAYRPLDNARVLLLGDYRLRLYASDVGGQVTTGPVHLASVQGHYALSDRQTLQALYALRRVQEADGPNFSAISLAQLGWGIRAWERYRLDLYARNMWDNLGSSHAGWAAELTVLVAESLGVSLGYSSLSPDDPDLTDLVDWPRGWYLKVALKF